ncbi:hypothetical protein [uncultured Kordia sp.]|uniref:hypothetical protein n=1 Tax=uncultured Kordia sp. TaxID=507699 RepID=UPI00262CF4E8|nr:hypothetical protein [uncultured Kordia sp.]
MLFGLDSFGNYSQIKTMILKNYIFLFITFISFQLSLSQEYDVTYETIEVIKTRSIYLNGGLRSQFGGKSRIYIPIDLPKNTVKWYYSFSTKKGKSGIQNLNLALQLSSMILDPSTLTSQVTSQLKIPEGSSSVDIYLTDKENIDKFIRKEDNDGAVLYYYEEGTISNTKSAIVEIDDTNSGTVYLGLKNPSASSGVNISIEVVAIIENRVLIEKSDGQQKAELYGDLGWTQFEKGNYQKCIEYSDKANNEFELGWVLANKGLAQLMLNKESDAMETYINAITLIKKQPQSDYVFSEVIKDINNALKIKPNLSGAEEIKQLIEIQ